MDHYKQEGIFKLERELRELRSFAILDPTYRIKKVLIWFIRTNIALFLYMLLWEYVWVRWTLVFYVPFNLISISSLFITRYLVKRKIDMVEQRLRDLRKRQKRSAIEEEE